MSNDGRLENAFSVAEDHLNVQKLLEPSGNNVLCLFQSSVFIYCLCKLTGQGLSFSMIHV